MNEDEVVCLIDMFHKYDKDGSRTIDAEELLPLMAEFGVELNKKAVKKLLLSSIPKGAKNQDVDLDTFLGMMTPYVRKRTIDRDMYGKELDTSLDLDPFTLLEMKRAFSRADQDGGGSISSRELMAITGMDYSQAKDIMTRFHIGAEGDELTFDEFCKAKVAMKFEVVKPGQMLGNAQNGRRQSTR